MAIQFYLDMIEQKKPELENCQTAYMSCSEVEEWEKKNAAASVSFDSGGVVEFLPIEMFSKDAKIEKYTETINPISIIYRLIQTDLERLKAGWKDTKNNQ